MKIQNKHLGISATLAGGCLWGLSGTCGQFLFTCKGACADWLVPLRLVSAGVLLTVFYALRRPDLNVRILKNKKEILTLLLYGILGLMLCQYSYFKAIEYSNAGTATVLQYLSPVLIMAVMCLWERRLPRLVDCAAVFLALAGVYLLATGGVPEQLVISGGALLWGIFSAFTVVAYTLIPRGLMRIYPTPYLLGWAMLIGGITLSLLRKPWQYHPRMDGETVLCLAVIVLLGTVASFSLYMWGVMQIGPEKASLYACVEPVSAALFSALWLGEQFTKMDLAGFACILSTLFLITLWGKGSRKKI
ncbi:MAG: DMT family transporter [Clostridiales bacterium]|nr:DMT family transporter [Clostridiales bacterium]